MSCRLMAASWTQAVSILKALLGRHFHLGLAVNSKKATTFRGYPSSPPEARPLQNSITPWPRRRSLWRMSYFGMHCVLVGVQRVITAPCVNVVLYHKEVKLGSRAELSGSKLSLSQVMTNTSFLPQPVFFTPCLQSFPLQRLYSAIWYCHSPSLPSARPSC
ncbi:hypothetical protein BD289DRAFT_439276 [Coniella lustricola]|uniref:Uncharacterized protein n=1 Tax=Coniella lustricola TaxID=2025994 RepID=A0A2T3A1S0_9PEZI|nr:hypothetical protein BD289DRAFT_439276 [Coniella lustricola]